MPFHSLHRIAMTCAVSAALVTPALADPTVGLGLSFSLGGGQVDTGVGLRVFSDDKRDSVVGSLGVDYMFGSQSWRGTVGAAYLGDNSYIGLDLGIGLRDGAIDFGASVGLADTRRAPSIQPDGELVSIIQDPPPDFIVDEPDVELISIIDHPPPEPAP